MSFRTLMLLGVTALIIIVAINMNRQKQQVTIEEGTVVNESALTAESVVPEQTTITPTNDGAIVEEKAGLVDNSNANSPSGEVSSSIESAPEGENVNPENPTHSPDAVIEQPAPPAAE